MDNGGDETKILLISPEHMELHKRLVCNTFDILKNVKFNNSKVDSKKIATYKSSLDDNDKKILLEDDMDILKHIRLAVKAAQEKEIKANMIIIDEKLAYTNKLLMPRYGEYSVVQPMIFGLKIVYQKNLTEDLAANFILLESSAAESQVNALRERNRELEEKLEKIKELLGVEDI